MGKIKQNLRRAFVFCGIIFSCSLFLREPSLGDESREGYSLITLTTEDEHLIRQKARQKAYPGGIDEESLEVQTQLAVPARKGQMAPEEMLESLPPSEEGKDNADD